MPPLATISELHSRFQSGFTCVEVVQQYLDAIKVSAHLNAFIEVFETESLQRAKQIDEKLQNGTAGKLAGVAIGIKDNICYKGYVASAASAYLKNFESLESATAVEKLEAEDAILIGRLNCDEFAMGSSNENSCYGPVKNAIDPAKVAGGSSGGSAVAVAAGLCHAALGSDTGGSVRQPASFNGVLGFKPSYGAVSRSGLIAYASSLDQIGVLANHPEDVELIFDVIAGQDPKDATSQTIFNEKNKQTEPSNLRFAYFKETIDHHSLKPEIKSSMLKTFAELKSAGHVVDPVAFNHQDYIVPTYYIIAMAEASSNLSRYDGIHFGYRTENPTDFIDTYTKSRSEAFGPEVTRRIMMGAFVLSEGYFDDYYQKACRIRELICQEAVKIFRNYDLILAPTAPGVAFDLGAKNDDPVQMYLEDIYTVFANLVGLPAISLPLGLDANGLPFGLQATAEKYHEKNLIGFSTYFLKKTTRLP